MEPTPIVLLFLNPLLEDSDDDEAVAALDAADKQPNFAVDSDHSDEAPKAKKKKKKVVRKKKAAAASEE